MIVSAGQVALIERNRDGRTYYLFPGGGVEPNERIETAAVREANEELGVHVRLDRLVAVVRFQENLQYYYTASVVLGEFGTGTGEELKSDAGSVNGSYKPVWMPTPELHRIDIRPAALAEAIQAGQLLTLKSPLEIDERG